MIDKRRYIQKIWEADWFLLNDQSKQRTSKLVSAESYVRTCITHAFALRSPVQCKHSQCMYSISMNNI
jgi:hypothetical protein